jgi:hypothetical protein
MGINADDHVLQKLKMKKFFAQYEYLETELSETQYLFDIYNKDFLKETSGEKEVKVEDEVDAKVVNVEVENDVKGGVEDDIKDDIKGDVEDDVEDDVELDVSDAISEIDESLKKLYKMLSLKTHPDKNGGDQKLFIEVKQAYHDKNIFKLIIIATKLNVDISHVSDAIELFEKSISEMQLKIQNFKKTIAWHWAHADNVKKEKIREYIKKN